MHWLRFFFMLRIPTHRPPTHPGEMLREEFLGPFEMTAQKLANLIKVPEPVIESLIEERAGITPDLALRLARLFGTTAEFWLNGQMVWDLYHAMHAPEAAGVENITPLNPSNAEEANPIT